MKTSMDPSYQLWFEANYHHISQKVGKSKTTEICLHASRLWTSYPVKVRQQWKAYKNSILNGKKGKKPLLGMLE